MISGEEPCVQGRYPLYEEDINLKLRESGSVLPILIKNMLNTGLKGSFFLCCHFRCCFFGAVGLLLLLRAAKRGMIPHSASSLPPSDLLHFFFAELSVYSIFISFISGLFQLFFSVIFFFFLVRLFAATGITCTSTLVFALLSCALLCSALLCIAFPRLPCQRNLVVACLCVCEGLMVRVAITTTTLEAASTAG